MNGIDKLLKQVRANRASLQAFDARKQTAIEKQVNQRSDAEAAMVDYFDHSFEENLNAAQDHYKDRISPEALSKALGMYRKALRALPLMVSTPYEKTAQGVRQTLRYSKSNVREFLASLNSSYADFDFDERLLCPNEVVEVFKECNIDTDTTTLAQLRREGGGPDCIQLNARVYRYRLSDVLNWAKNPIAKPLAISEMIMGDFS